MSNDRLDKTPIVRVRSSCLLYSHTTEWLIAVCVLLLASGLATATAAEKKLPPAGGVSGGEDVSGWTWKTVKHEGRDYVSAESIQKFYGFDTIHAKGGSLDLRAETISLHGTVGSFELRMNDVRFDLSHPLASISNELCIARIDVAKLLEPVLRPSRIALEGFDTVFLDAARGGKDRGPSGICGQEKELTLGLASAIKGELEKRGLKVIMTRKSDVEMTARERVAVANKTSKCVFLSLRLGAGDPEESGFETMVLPPRGSAPSGEFPAKEDLAELTGNQRDPENMVLAAAIQSQAFCRLGFADRGVRRGRPEVLKGLKCPGVVITAGFVTNEEDAKIIGSRDYDSKVAAVLGDALFSLRNATKDAGGDGKNTASLLPAHQVAAPPRQTRAETDFMHWKYLAEDDFVAGMMLVADCYDRGDGVAKNHVESLLWFRKLGEKGEAQAQRILGFRYAEGMGAPVEPAEAAKWFRRAAEQGDPVSQYELGGCFTNGVGVPVDPVQAVIWYRKSAEQNFPKAQVLLGSCYASGAGVSKNMATSAEWYLKAAEQSVPYAQFQIAARYFRGEGVIKDYVEGYKFLLLASAQGDKSAKEYISFFEAQMTKEQIAVGQAMASKFKPHDVYGEKDAAAEEGADEEPSLRSGTGFFISEVGDLVTNHHVVAKAHEVKVMTADGLLDAKVIATDPANDLALLKVEGQFAALPVAASRGVRLGDPVATVGFPNVMLQGLSPKLSKGDISSLSGIQDDPRHFQISVPVQPGNSGGALVDTHGNVVGVVSHKLNQELAVSASGTLAENVSYAVKSSLLLTFLESVPNVSARLTEMRGEERKFQDVVSDIEQCSVMILVK